MSGLNCKIKKECPDRHPPLCKNFVKNTCGFLVGNKFIVYSNCAFFHPPGGNQEPTSINSVMLTTTATVQNTPQDARSEIEVKSDISPADQVTKQLSDLDSKIVKMEQNISMLADKIANMESKFSQVDEAIKQSDSMQTNQANQDLRQEMDKMNTDITDKVDRVGTELNSLVEKVTFMKNEIKQDLKQEMDKMKTYINKEVDDVFEEMQKGETSIRETTPYMLCHEISKEDGSFSKALQTQIHKIVKEYQQLHRT